MEFVLGRQTELVKLGVSFPGVSNSGAAGVGAAVGIGLNSTTVNSADFMELGPPTMPHLLPTVRGLQGIVDIQEWATFMDNG